MHLLYIAAVATTLVAQVYGGTKTKCQVVAALRAEGVPDSDLRDWLCLVKHESDYRYDIDNTNSNGSRDYGIFQLNSKYWCKGSKGYSGTTCWKLNTYGCKDTCSSFKNSDISNDADCAVRIKNCFGFGKWVAHSNHCTTSEKNKSKYDYSSC